MTVDLASDRLSIRNIIYTAWSLFNSNSSSSGGGGGAHYSRWEVQKMADDRGYLLLLHFPSGFRIALGDMLTLQDACPLRIDSIFVRDAAEKPGSSSDDGGQAAAAVLCICILNSEQPVQLTETEIVRIRKRSRGLLGTAQTLLTSSFGKKK